MSYRDQKYIKIHKGHFWLTHFCFVSYWLENEFHHFFVALRFHRFHLMVAFNDDDDQKKHLT